MGSAKNNSFLWIAVIVTVVVIIVVAAIVFLKCRKPKIESSSSSHSRKREAVNSWKKLAGLPMPTNNQLSLQPNLDPFSYTLIFEEPLESYKKKIFPLQIKDITLSIDPTLDPDYQLLLHALRDYHRAPTQEELAFLLKYQKFLARDDVYSMCGPREIEQMYVLLLNIVANGVPGDIVETGVWRGGMGMWMKAVLNHFRDAGKDSLATSRKIWLFDAFGTFPSPQTQILANGDEIQPHEKDLAVHALTKIMYSKPVDVYQVREQFQNLGLLDNNVRLVKGLFSDTIPLALLPINEESSQRDSRVEGIRNLAILRIDNDYYDSVLFVLESLYPLLSKGGFVIIDDYNNPVLGCKDAVHYFRSVHDITSPIIDTYGGSVYWLV
jgi:hypothetical protein